MKTGYRIDSPVHKNGKPLQNKDLPQAKNGDYKSAYKQNRKNAIIPPIPEIHPVGNFLKIRHRSLGITENR
jgi:hypothetical protein